MAIADQISAPNTGTLVELDCRENSDEKVQLFWQPITKHVYVRITTQSEITTARVPNDEARHAFNHPYCYV